MPSRKLALWLGVLLLFLPVLAGLALPVTGYGLLIRYDPMAVSETEPSFVQDVACIYAAGIRSVTVFSLGNTKDAECSRFYKLDSLPVCPRSWASPLASPVLCEHKPEL